MRYVKVSTPETICCAGVVTLAALFICSHGNMVVVVMFVLTFD